MRRHALGVLLLAVALLTSACANIPDESTPHAVMDEQKQQPKNDVAGPTPDLDAYNLVREFIHRSGNPQSAELYLTDRAKQRWDRNEPPTIITDTFDTVPVRDPRSLNNPGMADSNDVKTVVLEVTPVGKLGQDHAFLPAIGDQEYNVTVRKQKDGQWRIDSPPPTVFVPLMDFKANYREVTTYYFDPDLRITVPDLRYVTAEPAGGLPSRVVDVLLSGPSDTMRRSVRSPLDGVHTRTNVVPDTDGALIVDLIGVRDKPTEQREQIAAQVVLTLQTVTSSTIRLTADGQDLVPGHRDWRLGDVKAYDAPTKPDSDQPGMLVAGGRVRSLRDGQLVPGPLGDGEFDVVTAAQSVDGTQLAAVVRNPGGPRLEIGSYGGAMQEVDLTARTMSRPTWRVSTSETASTEVWTVADGQVVRVYRTSDGTWKAVSVNASELTDFGPITQLRLSRDGTRAAVVAKGRIVVASVVRDEDSVSLRWPRRLQPLDVLQAVGVDWYGQDTLVVATAQGSIPVISLSVDGMKLATYDRNNLQLPIRAVAAAPDRDVIVTDNAAVSSTADIGQLWRQHPHGQGADSIPFYPG